MKPFTCAYKVKADVQNNRLIFSLRGCMVDEYVKRVGQQVRSEISKLVTGFEVIHDMRKASIESRTAREELNLTHDYMLSHGAGNIVYK